LGFIGLTPKRKKNKEKIINNKKCVPTAQYINPSAKPTPILFFYTLCVARFWGTLSKSLILSKGQVLILSYLLFNRVAINYNLKPLDILVKKITHFIAVNYLKNYVIYSKIKMYIHIYILLRGNPNAKKRNHTKAKG